MIESARPGRLWAHGLVKRYDGVPTPAVAGVDLEVPPGAFVTLLGPSGCGKSTTLRMLVGLERPTAGVVGLDDETFSDTTRGAWVPPHRRNLGMVFQSYAIWPHMTVWDNVAFPLRVRRKSRGDIERAVARALEKVHMTEFAPRSASRLSGGQQQRVAIARALAQSPKVLLLDEPLSNLDAALRRHMRTELKDLQEELGVTTVYVTHDQTEAFSLSDRIVVMKSGRVEQAGQPQALHDSPETVFVAEFLGGRNILPGYAPAKGAQTIVVKDNQGNAQLKLSESAAVTGPVVAVCHAKRSRLVLEAGENCMAVTVRRITYEGDHWEISCTAAGSSLSVLQVEPPPVAVGAECFMQIPAHELRIVRDDATSAQSTVEGGVKDGQAFVEKPFLKL